MTLSTVGHRILPGRIVAAMRCGLLLCLVLHLPAGAVAQDTGRSGREDRSDARWIPGVSIQTGFVVNKRKGEVTSIERGFQDGRTTQLFGTFGASAQIETPRLSLIPSAPRLFARADVTYSVDDKESLVSEGVPDDPINKLGDGYNLEAGSVESVIGRGSSLRPQAEPLILGGGVGLSFRVEVLGRALRVKPSIEWTFQRDEFLLEFSDVEGNGADPARCQPECRAVSIEAQDTKGYHSLGPGIELDYDVGRAGDFRVSIFSRFQALSILGSRKTELSGTGTWNTRTVERIDGQNVITSIDPAPGRADTTVYSRYERDAWSYVAGAGFRIYWDPR